MPPILIGFFILIGATLGHSLVKDLDPRSDRNTRPEFRDPVPQGYHTWLSRSDPAIATNGTCDVTLFALANRNRIVRARLDGVEQALDSSFSVARRVPAGTRRYMKAEYLDPVGGAVLACHDVSLSCYGQVWGDLNPVQSPTGPCSETRVPSSENLGKPRLTGRHLPLFALTDLNTGFADVTVEFVLRGVITEAYYCPRLEVDWPDGTRTVREADCAPFAQVGGAERAPERWSFSRAFPAGEWPVTACLYKAGRRLTCDTVRVRVW
jgi:hypothetical protein